MIFSKLFNTVNDNLKYKKTPKEKNNRVNNIILNLKQGRDYQEEIRNKLDIVSKNSSLVENFTPSASLEKLSRREQNVLREKRNEYDRELSRYSTLYTEFMKDYNNNIENVKMCRTDCISNYSDDDKKLSACKAGCDLQGPYLETCKDTYAGKSGQPSLGCTNLTTNKCAGGKIVGGQLVVDDLNREDNQDERGIGLIDGCCDCGGGNGGKPTGFFLEESNVVTTCTDITDADETVQGELRNICSNQTISQTNTLRQSYLDLKLSNQRLNNISKSIFDKYNTFLSNTRNNNLNIQSQERDNGNKIDQYAILYNDYDTLVKNNGSELITLDGQLENVKLNNESQNMKYIIWVSVATLMFLITLQKLKN